MVFSITPFFHSPNIFTDIQQVRRPAGRKIVPNQSFLPSHRLIFLHDLL